MSSDYQDLHNKMQDMFDRTQTAKLPKNSFHALGEFCKELITNPLLEEERNYIATSAKNNVVAKFIELRVPFLNKINITKNALLQFKEAIPVLGLYLDEYDFIEKNTTPNSGELVLELNNVLFKIYIFLKFNKSDQHTQALKLLAKIDSAEVPIE